MALGDVEHEGGQRERLVGGLVGGQRLLEAPQVEGLLGAIEVGKAADLVILSDKADPDEPLSLYWTSAERTIINGRTVCVRGELRPRAKRAR